MISPKLILLGVARPGFDTELAARCFTQTAEALESAGLKVVGPRDLLTEPEEIPRWLSGPEGADADAVVLQLSTFVDGRFAAEVASGCDLPILLWSLPEPEVRGRLRLNSLTGLNSAGYVLHRLHHRYAHVYRDPHEGCPPEALAWLRAAAVRRRLAGARIGVIGSSPPGFFGSDVDPLELQDALGPVVTTVGLEGLMRAAAEVAEPRYRPMIEVEGARVAGLDRLEPEQVRKSFQFEIVLRDEIEAQHLHAVAIRCWPEFISPYGGAACSTLAHLNDAGVPAACESDVLGAVSMLIEHLFTGETVFLGDLVHLDRQENSAVFWHCGAGAISLASSRTGAVAGVQPNRNLAYALNNPLKTGAVTILRVGQGDDGLRMLVASGTARDDRSHFFGTSVEVELRAPVDELLDGVIGEGYEFHYAIVWEDIREELVQLSKLAGTPVTVY